MKLKVESSVLRFHLHLFQLFGFFPLSLHPGKCVSTKTERFQWWWSLVLLLTFINLTIHTFLTKHPILYDGDAFGRFNDALKVVMSQIAIAIIHLESLLKREDLRKFWVHYMCLQCNTSPHCKWINSRTSILKELRHNFNFLSIFFGILLLELCVDVEFIDFLMKSDELHLTLFWSMFLPYVLTVRLRILEFIFHIEIIRHELIRLNLDVALLVEYTRFAQSRTAFEGFAEYLRCKIVHKQRIYQHIYEMFISFQAHLGLSMVFVLLSIYVRVVVDSYFAYYRNYRDWDRSENLLIIPACLEIPAFLLTSKNCMNVVKHITFHLHSIVSNVDDNNNAISVQIQNFSLQILHQKIRIDGLGIATMDGYMLTRAVGSITTYMIFFIQFMPKFQNI